LRARKFNVSYNLITFGGPQRILKNGVVATQAQAQQYRSDYIPSITGDWASKVSYDHLTARSSTYSEI